MKTLLTFALVLGVQWAVLAQTRKPATPTKKPTTTQKTTTPPKTVTAAPVATPEPAPKPASTTTPTATETPEEQQKRQQELYDKYHGTTEKTTTPATNTKAKSSTAAKPEPTPKPEKPAKTETARKQEMSRPTEYSTRSNDESKLKVGVRAGVNLGNFGEAGKFVTDGIESPVAFHGGLVFNIGGKLFSVQPEILFSQFAIEGRLVEPITGTSVVGSSTLNQVQVPILLKLAFGGDKLRFFINGGGYGSYAINGNSKSTINGSTTTSKITFDNNEGRFEYGAVGGAGIQLGIGRAQLLLEGRYNYGLGSNAPKVQSQVYSRIIMGSVGVLIPL
jgi:Outer membrane protein beta-barrel domain